MHESAEKAEVFEQLVFSMSSSKSNTVIYSKWHRKHTLFSLLCEEVLLERIPAAVPATVVCAMTRLASTS